MRRRCIRPLVVKAVGGLSLTPSDTGVMPQKIHPSSGTRNAREQLNSEGSRLSSQTHWLHLVGLRRSLVSLYCYRAGRLLGNDELWVPRGNPRAFSFCKLPKPMYLVLDCPYESNAFPKAYGRE